MNNLESKQKVFPIFNLDDLDPEEFVAYYLDREREIEGQINEKGAIKFRGVQVKSLESFQFIVDSVANKFLSYIDGNSPRTKLSGNVYTSTEYDKTQKITMHNELSYSAKWPNKLFFSCLQPAETGGETLLVDSREILGKMNPDIVSEIESRGVIYFRNLHGGMGMGPSWQDTFETDDKVQLEAYCKSYSIDFEWSENNSLRLKQPSKGIIEHRVTKERVWFNQIDQFHPSHLGKDIYEVMSTMYTSAEEFPMYVTYGDGKPIQEDMIHEIINTINDITIAPPWQRDEFLIVDNELFGHGRNSFTGDRRVLVAMSK
ncbi:MAG: TauD/TfdA family dioxygenase [Bacteroidota bacterium]|mgnify:CR=1 FL=1